jgi:putative tricarboxylic transport membrane protein
MALDRWVALVFLIVCLAYGYTAFFVMDASIAPFMRRNPVWPSSFPKILSVLGIVLALAVIFAPGREGRAQAGEIDWRRLHEYALGQALVLIGLMIVYALALRDLGFIASTAGFLVAGSALLGERRWARLVAIALVASVSIWYLVQEVLGIFLRPLPAFLAT